MFRVLVADKLPQAALDQLSEMGCVVTSEPSLKGAFLTEKIAQVQPEVLVVRSTRVTADDFAASGALSLVVRAGAGVNTIDLSSASGMGVYVANCPGKNAVAVAELAWAHILNADRRVADGVSDLRDGVWKKKVYSKEARGLKGRVLGIVGLGAIGREVASRGQAFEMTVVAFDPALTRDGADELGVSKADSLCELASRSDVVTVHVGLNEHTRGMLDAAFFDALPANAIFVNTSRGPVVDEQALSKAIREKSVRAGLDVFCDEPASDGEWSSDLVALPGVYGTHHIGASTDQAQEAVALEACRVISAYANTGNPPNCVNLARQTPATHLLVVRHRDEVGVLSGVLGVLKEAAINVQNMENNIFSAGASGERAACARIQMIGSPSEPLLEQLKKQETIFEVKLILLEEQ